jgi:hypothetical protein
MYGWRFSLVIIASLFSSVLYAQHNPLGLKHIRLTPAFAEAINNEVSIQKGVSLQDTPVSVRQSLVPFLFDREIVTVNAEAKLNANKRSGDIGDGQQSLMYQEIQQWLEGRYQSIGQAEADRVNFFNSQFNMGTQNFSGFSWQKPFGGFGLFVDRQISPDLFDDKRWNVMDTMTIVIEATTFLSKMSEAGAVDMSADDIKAFAGMSFKRVYTSYHFADSFGEALITDFRYMFLPFLYHTPRQALALDGGKFLKREDTWSVGAGGVIESPAWYGLSFSGGALAEMTNKSSLILQSIRPAEAIKPGEFLRITHASEQTKSAGITAGLQLDFFKLIQFTLLSYDLEFEAEKNKAMTLSFKEEHRDQLADGSDTAREFNRLLSRNSPEIRFLEPYVVQLNEGSSSSSNSRTMLLLWGNLKKASMEQVRVIKDQTVKTFFRNYSESIRLVQNFWSRLFSSFIFRIFKFSSIIKNDAAFTRKLEIEYEATLPQSPDPNKMVIESQEQFSMTANLSFEAARTDRWTDRSYKKDAEDYLERYTANLNPEFRTMIRNEDLKGPLRITTNVRVMGDGLAHFNNMSEALVKQEFEHVCDKKSSCVRRLLGPYLEYKRILAGTGRYELAQLKIMMTALLKEIDDLATFSVLFGEYAFVNGTFYATSRQGMPFSTTYSLGQFRGLGVIDTYQRLNGTRQPASVWE